MAGLTAVALTEQIDLGVDNLVMQTFRVTTSARGGTHGDYIWPFMSKIHAVIGHAIKGPAGTMPVKATGTLTISAALTAADTITIGTRVYTAAADPTVKLDNFDVGTTATNQAAAIVKTINLSGAAGTDYPTLYQTANEDVIASAVAGVITITALRNGLSGNKIVTTESGAQSAFGSGTLLGGLGRDKGVRAASIYTFADVNVATKITTIDGMAYTCRAIPGAEVGAHDEAAVTQEDAARNLNAAIRDEGTAGWYGTSTIVHPRVHTWMLNGAAAFTVISNRLGRKGSTIAVSENETNGSWGGAVTALAGGLDGGTNDPHVDFQYNAKGLRITEGTNDGYLGVGCSLPSMEIEVTIIGKEL